MAILLLAGTGGSPGVTTLAVGMALTWPRPILLADCDPGAHQAILAGYLAGRSARRIVTVAHFERRFSTRRCPCRLKKGVVGSFYPASQSRPAHCISAASGKNWPRPSTGWARSILT